MDIPVGEQELFKLCANPDLVDFNSIKDIPYGARNGNVVRKNVMEPAVKFGNTISSMRKDGYFAIVSSKSQKSRTELVRSIISYQQEFITGGLLVSFLNDDLLESAIPHTCVHRNLDVIESENRLQKIIDVVKEMKEKGTPIYPIVIFNDLTVRERRFLEQSSCQSLIYNARHYGIKFIISVSCIHEISKRFRQQAQYVFAKELDKQVMELSESEMEITEKYTLQTQLLESSGRFVSVEPGSDELKMFRTPDVPKNVTMGSVNFWSLNHMFANEKSPVVTLTKKIQSNVGIPILKNGENKNDQDQKDIEKIFKVPSVSQDLLKDNEDPLEDLLHKVVSMFSKYEEELPKSQQNENVSQEVERLTKLNDSLLRDNEMLSSQYKKYRKENEEMIKELTKLNEKLDKIHSISTIKE